MKKLDPTIINREQGNPKVEGEYLVLHEEGGMSYVKCYVDEYDCDNNSITWMTMDGYNAELIGKVIGFYDINGYYID